MAWTDSKIFRAAVADVWDNTAPIDLGSDVPKAALFNNSVTPDNDVTSVNSAYNVGQWGTANEVYQSGQWPQGGVALAGTSLNSGTADVVFYDATDTASGSAATLANIYGVHIYDDTLTTPVADQGLCYLYYGGVNSVTNGTFTSVWNALGLMRWTL